MSALRWKDKDWIKKTMNLRDDYKSEEDAKSDLYPILALPLQGVCSKLKRIGGNWR